MSQTDSEESTRYDVEQNVTSKEPSGSWEEALFRALASQHDHRVNHHVAPRARVKTMWSDVKARILKAR